MDIVITSLITFIFTIIFTKLIIPFLRKFFLDVPNKRRFVDIFLYLATYPHVSTVDQYIWSLAKKKYKIISKFENSLKEKAIDCEIFYEANVYDDEEELKCDSGLFPEYDDDDDFY